MKIFLLIPKRRKLYLYSVLILVMLYQQLNKQFTTMKDSFWQGQLVSLEGTFFGAIALSYPLPFFIDDSSAE